MTANLKFFMSILCTICMRSGSKGLKNKNLHKINNKYLMEYTINQALKSKVFDHISVSTDSPKIIRLAKKFGVHSTFLRSKNLSGDRIGKIKVIKDLVYKTEKKEKKFFKVVCDLDVTSPLRLISDIKEAYKKFKRNKLDFLTSACNSRKNPYFNIVIRSKKSFYNASKNNKIYFSRQTAPKTFDLNASIYFWKRDSLLKDKIQSKDLFIMPAERSIDIDDQLDFEIVSYLIKKNNNYKKLFF